MKDGELGWEETKTSFLINQLQVLLRAHDNVSYFNMGVGKRFNLIFSVGNL